MEDLRFNIHLTDETSSTGGTSPAYVPPARQQGPSQPSTQAPTSPQERREGPLSSRIRRAVQTTDEVARATIEINESNLKRLKRSYEDQADAIRDTTEPGPERRDQIKALRRGYEDTRDAIKEAESARKEEEKRVEKARAEREAAFEAELELSHRIRVDAERSSRIEEADRERETRERANVLFAGDAARERARAEREAEFNSAREAEIELTHRMWTDAARAEQARAMEVEERQAAQRRLFTSMMDEQDRRDRDRLQAIEDDEERLHQLRRDALRDQFIEEATARAERRQIFLDNLRDDRNQASDIRRRVSRLNSESARILREGEREGELMRRAEAIGVTDFADQRRYATDPIYREQVNRQHAADTAAGFGRLNQLARAFPGIQPILPTLGAAYGAVTGAAGAAQDATGFIGGAAAGTLAGAVAGQATRMVISTAGQRVGQAIGGALGTTVGSFFGPVVGAVVGRAVGRAIGAGIARIDAASVGQTLEGAGRFSPGLAFATAENTVSMTQQRLMYASRLDNELKSVTKSEGRLSRAGEGVLNELYDVTAEIRTGLNTTLAVTLETVKGILGVANWAKDWLLGEEDTKGRPNFLGINIEHLPIPEISGEDGVVEDPIPDNRFPGRIPI